MAEFALHGHDLFGEVVKPKASGPVAERFTLPPFTVLDARMAEWQERKRAWAALGIRGEEGRSAKAYNIHGWVEDKRETVGWEGCIHGDGTSIFDPVMVELAVRWF